MPLDPKQVLKPFRQVNKTLTKHPRNPPPEAIHDFRTGLRRIEAAIDAFGMGSQKVGKNALQSEKRFRRRAGKVRDMDVLMAMLDSSSTDEADECRLELLEYLGAERYRQAKKLHGEMSKKGTVLRKRLQDCARAIEQQIGPQADPSTRADAAAAVAARALQLCQQLSSYPALTRGNLHEFRLEVKKVRYMLQMSSESDEDLIHALGETKDKIGEWHDWEQLSVLARDEVIARRDHPLLRELRKISEQRFTEAMRTAQRLRSHHLITFQRSAKRPAARAAGPAAVVQSLAA